jgi:hypothetical protein
MKLTVFTVSHHWNHHSFFSYLLHPEYPPAPGHQSCQFGEHVGIDLAVHWNYILLGLIKIV